MTSFPKHTGQVDLAFMKIIKSIPWRKVLNEIRQSCFRTPDLCVPILGIFLLEQEIDITELSGFQLNVTFSYVNQMRILKNRQCIALSNSQHQNNDFYTFFHLM